MQQLVVLGVIGGEQSRKERRKPMYDALNSIHIINKFEFGLKGEASCPVKQNCLPRLQVSLHQKPQQVKLDRCEANLVIGFAS